VKAVVDIARLERKSLYEDIEFLISDNSRFALENLLQYTPQIWLSRRNQVIVKFIETLTHNNLNTDSPNNEKLYKRAMAVDLIYGSRHGRYVSEMNLAASAIKYSITRSKMMNNNNPASLFGPIPITKQEATAQENEATQSKAEIILKRETLLEQVSESIQKKYGRIKYKRREELLKILEEVRFLFNSESPDTE